MNRISILFAAMAMSGLAQADDTTHAAIPTTPQAWAAKMLDPTRNGSAFKDPALFTQWVNAMLNPATSMALAQQVMDPNTAIHTMSGMMNPASLQNYMQFADPSIIVKWITATMDPNFYNALFRQGMDPSNVSNWVSAPVNPQMLNLGTQMLNPAMYGNWMTAPMNPAALNAMAAPMNPGMYMNWMGTAMNPNTYGPWGRVLPATPGAR